MITEKELKDIFNGKRRSAVYERTVKLYEDLKVHAFEEFPEKLIRERRPHEPADVFKYRCMIYESVTADPISSVVQELGKIRRSTDWSIKYNSDSVPPQIIPAETLESYCEKNLPNYTSLTNWVFSVLLKNYCIDANAMILIKALDKKNPNDDREYLRPYPYVFNSNQVLDYKPGQYAVFEAADKYISGTGSKMRESDKYYVVTDTTIQEWIKKSGGNGAISYVVVEEYPHNLGYLPVVPVRAIFEKTVDEYTIYKSRIASMVPRLNEAAREYSDQQANVVNHMHPREWEVASQNCDVCINDTGISTGKVRVETGKGEKKTFKMVDCNKCGGTGYIQTSGPYKKTLIKPAAFDQKDVPVPPFGIQERDVRTIEAVDKRIESHLFKALASINMQFLSQTPLSISGDAKQVDREALNNFVYGIAEDLVWMMDDMYRIICDYRYSLIVPDEVKRKEMLPSVAVPEKFDLVGSNVLADEVKAAIDSKLSPVIVSQLLIDYCSKKFYQQPEVRDEQICVIDMDPMLGTTEEEKMMRLQNGGVEMADYILSCNIVPFVKRAIREDKDFLKLPRGKQLEVLNKYTTDKLNAAKTKTIPTPPVV